MIKRAVVITILMVSLQSSSAMALCAGAFLNPITDVCWECIFPIKIMGIPVISVGSAEDTVEPPGSQLPCVCPIASPPYYRVGIPISFWEPARVIETVKDPWCFPMIGTSVGSAGAGGALRGTGFADTSGADYSTFAQAHYYIFPVWAILGMLVDYACLENDGFDVAYVTELDPLWQDDLMTTIITPEVMLFTNPIAQLACIADSVAANAGIPLDPLFWCMGSWGSAYPLTGHANSDSYVQANAAIAARMIYKLGRELLLCDPAINLCYCTPTPIWVKSHYRLQIARPIPGRQCIPVGRSGLIWAPGKNPPTFAGDNFLFMMFRKQACCAF